MSHRDPYTREFDAGSEFQGRRLRRNKIDGVLGGVCAGLGDWLGIDHGPVRIFFVLIVIFTAVPALFYLLMWMFIPSDKRAPYVREHYEEVRAQRRGEAPADSTSYGDVRSKFRSLEECLQDLERSVTSREWRLRRDFRDLES